MKVARQQQTHQSKSWSVTSGAKEYRAVCYWSGGDLRMTWLVEAYVKVAQGTSHWRRIAGRAVIGAIMEFENAEAKTSTDQQRAG